MRGEGGPYYPFVQKSHKKMPPYQKKKSQQIKKSVVRSKEKVSTKLKQERVCSLKDRLWGRVIYCINMIFLVSKIKKISSRVNLKIFKEKTDKPQFLVKKSRILAVSRSFWQNKKNLEH